MRTIALALACSVCCVVGRRTHRFENSDVDESDSLTTLLLAMNPSASRHASRQGIRMQEDTPAAPEPPKFDVRDMAGVTAPLGFWDPFGYSDGASEGKIRFYREVEIKHGRVAMLAALGYLVAEQFHPLFGGNIDVPSLKAFQETPLQSYWAIAVGIPVLLAIPEVFSVFTFESPSKEWWAIKKDHEPGNLGFDPLGLKPKDPAALKEMQTKELNNGRLAMIAFAGMVYQEIVTGGKLF